MPIDTSMYPRFQQPQPIPVPSPLDALGKVLQIKNAIAQQPLIDASVQNAQLENQQKQIQLQNAQGVQKAFASANKLNPDGSTSFDMDNLKTALAGTPGGLEVLKNISGFEKGQADLQEAQGKVDLQHRDNGGSLGAAVNTLVDKDPLKAAHLFLAMGANGVANKTIDPNTFAPHQQAVQNALQQDPTGQSAAPILKQLSAQLIANSPAQTKLATESQAAQARADAAKNAADRLNLEAPGIAAGNTIKEQQASGTQPVSPVERLRLDIEKANSERAAAAQQETLRHNAVDEKLGAGRLGVEQNRLAQTTGGVALNPRQESIAQQLASGDMKPSDLSRYPDKEALRARALEINSNFNDQTYATKKAFTDPQSVQSKNLGTISRIVGHIGQFESNSAKLGVSPSMLTGANLTGLAAATHEDAHAISSELEKLVSGGVGTEGQVREWQKGLTSTVPSIRQQAVDEISRLIGSQYEGMNQSYKAGVGSDLPIDKYVSPAGREWMRAKGINTGGAAAVSGGAANLPASAISQLKEGQITHFGNGQSWTLKNGQPSQVGAQ